MWVRIAANGRARRDQIVAMQVVSTSSSSWYVELWLTSGDHVLYADTFPTSVDAQSALEGIARGAVY